jgi:branched-chain amino acid transport system substrate-binding protein
MKKRVIIAALMFVFTLSAEVIAGDVRGVTDTEVTIGITSPMSGPAAVWGAIGMGAKAWADYVNDQGGVHGRKIKVLIKDDAYNPTRAMANFQAFKDQVFAVAVIAGSPQASVAKNFFAENKIPLIMPYSALDVWKSLPKEKREYVFTTFLDYNDEGKFLADYAVKELGSKKIAVFYMNNDFGKPHLAGVKDTLQAMGGKAELTGAVPFEVGERALSAHAFKLKESGADAVILAAAPLHGSLIVKEMAKIGYRPKLLTSMVLADPVMYRLAGDLWEGTYVVLPGFSGVIGDPASDKVLEIILKYQPKVKRSERMALDGAVGMMHVVQGLKNAGRNLTPESLILGMEKIKDWKPESIGADVTYGPDRHQGNNAMRMGQAQKGKIVPLTDWTYFKTYF